MNGKPKAKTPFLRWSLTLGAAGFIVPIGVYWAAIGRVPSLPAARATATFTLDPSRTTLIDVRPSEAFAREHLTGTVNWPHATIAAQTSMADIPARHREHTLYLLSSSGIRAASAARKLRSLGLTEVYIIRDGFAGWISALVDRDASSLTLTGTHADPERYFRDASLPRQWLATFNGLTALRWGLSAFFVGEAACAVNYIVFRHESHLAEFTHTYGMLLCFACVTYALARGAVGRHISREWPPEDA